MGVARLHLISVGLIHCSRDPQVRNSAKSTSKLDLTALFTHLKIILLQHFHFSVIGGIQTNPHFTIYLIFATIHEFHYTILAIFYLYLQ